MSFREAAFRLVHKQLCQPFLEKLKDPGAAQEACLRKILHRCRNTLYGKDYGFADITSIEEFQQRVPITTIDSMQPYIARCAKGEQNILFPDKILCFIRSSGTTGDPKYFPLGEYRVGEYARERARGGLFYIIHGEHYDLLDGASIFIHSPPKTEEKCGVYDVGVASGAFYAAYSSMTQNQWFLREMGNSTIPTPEVNAIHDWEKKVYLTARLAVAADVRMAAGVTAEVVSLLRKINTEFYDQLLADPELDPQTKAKLRCVSKNRVINLQELWPNFTIFCASSVSVTPFRRIIQNLLGDVEIWDTYNAAEGTGGLQIYPDGGIVPIVDHTFFEFKPTNVEDAKPIPISDVQINTPYQILMTNHGGFYRYKLGDVVTFASLNPPEFGEITRMKAVLNLVGERLREELLLRALDYACQQQGTSFVECALLPEVTTDFTRYQLFVEFTHVPSDLQEFAGDVDSHLRKVSIRFDYSRKSNTLSPILIIPVRPGGFDTLLLEMGKSPGTSKVPRLLTPELSRLIPLLK